MNNTITMVPIDMDKTGAELQGDIAPLEKVVTDFAIKSPDMYEYAGEILKRIKAKSRDLDERRKSITAPLDIAKKSVMDLFRAPYEALLNMETVVKREMIAWQNKIEAAAREEQRKIDEKRQKEVAALEAKAAEARANGNDKRAEKLENKAFEKEITPVVVAPSTPKVEGVSYRDNWFGEVVDLSLVPREYLIPDMSAINRVIKATKGKMAIPGVAVKCEKILASR